MRVNIKKIFIIIVMFLFVFTSLEILFKDINILVIFLNAIILSFYGSIFLLGEDMLNPMMLLIIATGLGTMDVCVVSLGLRHLRYSVNEQYIIQSLVVINLWHMMFISGYFFKTVMTKNIIKNKSEKETIDKNRKILFDENIVKYTVIIIFIVGLLIILNISRNYGGLVSAMQNRKVAYENLGFLPLLLGLGGILPVLYIRKGKNRTAFFILIVVFISNALLGGRTGAIYSSIFPTLFYYNYFIKKITKKTMIIYAITIAFFAIVWGQLRKYNSIDISLNILNTFVGLTQNKNYGQNLPYLISSIDNRQIEYQYFNYLFNILFAVIPRAIWSSKPSIDEAGLIGRLMYGPNSTGQPVGAYGFAYISFGWFGIVIFGFITGYFVKKIHNYVIKKNIYEITLWYSYISFYLFSLWQTSAQLQIIINSILFILFIVTSKFLKTVKV